MSQPSNQVPTTALNVQPLLVGASIPKLALLTEEGISFDLNTALAKKPAVLIFYRGNW